MWRMKLLRQYFRYCCRNSTAFLPLKNCWQGSTIHLNRYWHEQNFLVIDAEMSALNTDEGELLSLGWVMIRQGQIQLHSAEHHLLKSENSVGQSAVIHHLRDQDLERGHDVGGLFDHLLAVAKNCVLVFHHADLDMDFLNVVCRKRFGAPLLLPTVDTLVLEKKKFILREQPISQGALRLGSCRARYNLPVYPAHNALSDALATAELLLAQLSHRGRNTTLKELL